MNKTQAKEFIKNDLERYLTSKGINTQKPFLCLNPEHKDSHPSMSYDKDRKKAHCFSCGVDYDTFDIIGIDYGLNDNKDKFKKAYELYDIELDKLPQGKQQTQTQAPVQEIPKQTSDRDYTTYFEEMHIHINETDYPQQRGLTEATINRFNLGYDKSWRSPAAVSSGKNPPATPRLIIPTGKGSYIARNTRTDLSEQEKAFCKMKEGSSCLYNPEALINSDKPIFIVEGEIDALSIIEVGGEAIALGSTANYKQLLKLLESSTTLKPFIIALDNDKTGKDTTEKLISGLQQLKIPYLQANIAGEHKDANEALQADREAFKKKVGEAMNQEPETVEEIIEQLGEEAEKIKKDREDYLRTSTANYIECFKKGIKDSVNTPFIPTGFPKLDGILDGGLFEGLYIVGAISSLGKTTLITQIADQIAQSGQDVLIFSLEMARSELMAKSISRHTVIDIQENRGDIKNAKTTRGITTGKRYALYNETERKTIEKAIESYEAYANHIFISEGVGDIGASQIREAVNKHILFTGEKPVVIIDYIQILAPYNDRATDKQNTDKAVMELKRISRDYKVPVIGISSFNRANYKEAVTMEAFKESGAIEYSSDVLIGLQLKGAGEAKTDTLKAMTKDPREIELVILKNRNGATGKKIPFNYYPLFNYFKEIYV